MDGEVIGINSQIATSTGDYNGIGFALPSTKRLRLPADSSRTAKSGAVISASVSIRSKPNSPKFTGLPEAKGAIVLNIRDKQSAAGACRLAVGDVILGI